MAFKKGTLFSFVIDGKETGSFTLLQKRSAIMSVVVTNNESGKVYVKGTATGEYACDKVSIRVSFYCTNLSAAKASETVIGPC